LEDSIRERVKRLLNSDVTDITPLDDLDAQLGTPPEEDFVENFGDEFDEYQEDHVHETPKNEHEAEDHVHETPKNEHEAEDVYRKG
jgi:hypothetical protein